MQRNKPLVAQQPAPAFANDPGGYWTAVADQNKLAGISSVLPGSTVIQSDMAVKSRLLQGQIGWTPCSASWKGGKFTASLSDAQFLLALAEGGDTQQGQITLLVAKLEFGAKDLPDYGDTIKIQAAGRWHEFAVTQIVGQHDDNEPGLTLFLDKDQNAIGD